MYYRTGWDWIISGDKIWAEKKRKRAELEAGWERYRLAKLKTEKMRGLVILLSKRSGQIQLSE